MTSPLSNRVLVPASSSPTAPVPSLARGPTLIQSSNISRMANGGGSYHSGSPQAVLAAFSSRGNGADTKPATSNAADFSPSSPPPLSRLKKRYADESPTKPSSSVSPEPLRPKSLPSSSRAPAGGVVRKGPPPLVAAAKKQHDAGIDVQVKRWKAQFPHVSRPNIVQALTRHGDNDRGVERELEMAEWKAKQAASRLEAEEAAKKAAAAKPAPVNLQSYRYQPTNGVSRSSSGTSVAPTPDSPSRNGKRRKNEKSTIYAKRDKERQRKRDPDEEGGESEAEEASDDSDDGYWSGEEGRRRKKRRSTEEDEVDAEGAAFKAFNEADADAIKGTIACSEDQVNKIISLRPYSSIDDLRSKLNKTRGVSVKLFEQYAEIMEGYVQIDSCLNRCESIANEIASALAVWKGAATASDSTTGTPRTDGLNDVKVDVAKVSELLAKETDLRRRTILSSYIRSQPATLSEGTVLKDYQLLGINWLNLLYKRRIGCILADEMGLGKTIQVIAFLAHLKELKGKGTAGPHMIFVPASTLENWTREFERFAPEVDVETYYGSQAERAELRDNLKRKFRAGKLEVVLASYTQVQSEDDLRFFKKKLEFETCIYDEAHALKNFQTKRYQDLLSIKPKWRLLLTGTPLQNNLQELVVSHPGSSRTHAQSLLMFIHKDIFTDAEQYLRAIFKVQAAGHADMLSQQRVSRARTMLTPFVLRRRKANVLSLPPKIETVESCEMTPVQARLYRETLRRSRKAITELGEDGLEALADVDDDGKAPKGKKAVAKIQSRAGNASNILMDLRKAASHPLLFRRIYNDKRVEQIAKVCMGSPKWCDSNYDYIVEDFQVMSDAEIHSYVTDNEELEKFGLDAEAFLEGGKMKALQSLIVRCKAEGKRILLFSQFTMILDIIQVALSHMECEYIRLDGQTRTDERQGLVDQFNDDTDITVFLLSTKAGGVGINLTAASVVVIFDQDFNPHNDRQAADRAYRIGQERSVEVIKLISKDSIDEDILSIGLTKLQLDDMVGGEGSGAATPGDGGGGDDKTAKEMKKSLLTTLRKKFEDQGDSKAAEDAQAVDEDTVMEEMTATQVKKARGSLAAK
ncbi:DNA-dependent ATPase fun30 [Vanrija albida]|uniref:DNA-dependent ATPase fun30 n=1 Tax=Vanrija albida TaxID=181172 RepID=A0ABR3Q6T5_9TREE